MNEHDIQQHLSQIATQWTMLHQAHAGNADQAAVARQVLMQRYCGAVFRYLLSAVRDPGVAEDLTQEFALRFIQGRFAQAEREKGRFRNYIKAALFRLVQDYYREQGSKPRPVSIDPDTPLVAPDEQALSDNTFRDSWRQELLSRAWRGLEQIERDTNQPYHAVLRMRVEQGDLSAQQLADILAERLTRPFTAAGVRQLLHRARERFAELLLDDIRQSMEDAPMDEVIEELAELNLLKYCKDIVDRR